MTDYKAYCVKCKVKGRPIQNPKKGTAKNGRAMVQGSCGTCGTKLTSFISDKKKKGGAELSADCPNTAITGGRRKSRRSGSKKKSGGARRRRSRKSDGDDTKPRRRRTRSSKRKSTKRRSRK